MRKLESEEERAGCRNLVARESVRRGIRNPLVKPDEDDFYELVAQVLDRRAAGIKSRIWNENTGRLAVIL